MICSACTTDVPDDDAFCENCGAKLREETQDAAAPSPACSCGAAPGEVDEDGFCLSCGKRLLRPASDHMEQALSTDFAAVSDRGLRHDRNEDRFALVQGQGTYGLVVCDGVSSTSNSEIASAVVSACVAHELTGSSAGGSDLDASEVVMAAIRAASTQLQTQTGLGDTDRSPSTTVVAALVMGDEITIGWAGDSRAYWINGESARALTRDHSWMNEALATAELTEEQARLDPHAHAITRWLGADAEEEAEPEIMRFPVQASGMLLLCTDGLWNYVEDTDSLFRLVSALAGEDRNVLVMARRLVDFAKEQGGRDNVTVALLHLGSREPETAEAASTEQNDDLDRKEDTEESKYAGSVQG